MDGWSWVLGPLETGKAPRKEGRRLSQILQNLQQTFAQAALFPTLAWPKQGVSDTSFELFPIFLIHFSLTAAITAVQPDSLASGLCLTWGCTVDALPGEYACATWSCRGVSIPRCGRPTNVEWELVGKGFPFSPEKSIHLCSPKRHFKELLRFKRLSSQVP